MQAETIDEVIHQLDGVIARCQAHSSRLGYFPALYRKVTVRVAEGIARGEFEDGPRMEALDVVFANRYLAAWDALQAGQRPSASWDVAFAEGARWPPLVIQHLLLGMNAHINLDLGVAAAEVAPGSDLASLKGDFHKINEVLASLVDGVKAELSDIWPLLRLLDHLAGNADDRMVDFSMQVARGQAWRFAESLAHKTGDDRLQCIAEADGKVAGIAERVRRPPTVARIPMLFMRVGERGTVPEIIELLK